MVARFMVMVFIGMAVAALAAAAPADAAFFFATNNSVGNIGDQGSGNGKPQNDVMGLNGDILLGLGDADSNANPTTILGIYNTNFSPDESLITTIGSGGRINATEISGADDCKTACEFDIGAAFGIYAVKYDGLVAFFQNDGDLKVEYKLGADNFGTSNFTFMTPLPAAAWLFGSAFLGLCWLGRRSGMRGVGALPS